MGPSTHAAALLLAHALASTAPSAPAETLDAGHAGDDARAEGPAPMPSSESAPSESAPPSSLPPPSVPLAPAPAPTAKPGIELATPPPSLEAPAEAAPADSDDDPYWPDPGRAPSDGIGALISGSVLIPSAAVLTILFIDPPFESDDNGEISTLVAGVGLGVIGVGFLGLGISQQLKLRRWAGAYRVRPTFQGNGMLAAGGLALNYGLALGLAGALGGQAAEPEGIALLCAGIGAAGLIAPPLLIFGKRARERYARTDGWVRPPLPPIPVSPSVQVHRQGFSLGFSGRF